MTVKGLAAYMPTVKLWTDAEVAASPRIQAVFEDIRATRKSDFVNNFWRALANQPELLERTWSSIKQVMISPGALDPLTRELIYIAVSTVNSCGYCIHSHTASARAKGMTQIAKDTGLSREQLYRSFSTNGNPTLKTTIAVMKALGIELKTKLHL